MHKNGKKPKFDGLPHLDDAAGEVAVGHGGLRRGAFGLGFGGPWDRGGGGERLGAKRRRWWSRRREMVACLLVHPGPCSLRFFTEEGQKEECKFLILSERAGIHTRAYILMCEI